MSTEEVTSELLLDNYDVVKRVVMHVHRTGVLADKSIRGYPALHVFVNQVFDLSPPLLSMLSILLATHPSPEVAIEIWFEAAARDALTD